MRVFALLVGVHAFHDDALSLLQTNVIASSADDETMVDDLHAEDTDAIEEELDGDHPEEEEDLENQMLLEDHIALEDEEDLDEEETIVDMLNTSGVALVSPNTYWGCSRKGVDGGHGCNSGNLASCAAKVQNAGLCKSKQFDFNPSWCGGQCKCVTSAGMCSAKRGHRGYTTYMIKSATPKLPAASADGIFKEQRIETTGSDIRAFTPRVASMRECLCKAAALTHITSAVNYHAATQKCIYLKKTGVNTNKRIAAPGWQTSTKLQCKKVMKTYKVPSSCDGKRGFEHAKCAKLVGEAGYTYGKWLNKKKCMTRVSTNPKMYDWAKAKDYCLKGNTHCNGIAKLTVKKNGKYVNEYTFCKAWMGRFRMDNLPATWPYGGVLEVRRKSEVQLPDDAFDKYR